MDERFWDLAALRKDGSQAKSGEYAAGTTLSAQGLNESVPGSRSSLDVVALIVDHVLAMPGNSREGAPASKECFAVRPLNGFFERAFCLGEGVTESKDDRPLRVAGDRADDLLAEG